MKKNILAATAVAAVCMSLASCGLGTAGKAASSNLAGNLIGTSTSTTTSGNLLGNALTGGTGTGLLGSVLSNLLGTKTSEKSLVGTWTYAAPKVVFESENVLAKLGGTVASSKVESTLSKQLKKIGMTAGQSKLTLNSDKTCTLEYNGKTVNGTYSYDTNTSKLTITGALGVGTSTCTATVSGNELYMLFDADKLLSVASGLSNGVGASSTLTSLLKSYDGLKLGWTMTK